MTIVFVSQEFPPETGWGGIGTYVDTITEAISAMGVDAHVLSTVEGQAPSRTVVNGTTVHRFPLMRLRGAGRVTRSPETVRRISTGLSVARLLPRLPAATTVECPEWMAEGLVVGLWRSVPLVVRLHSTARQLFPYTKQGRGAGGWDARGAIALEEMTARRADVVTSTAPNLAEMSGQLGLEPAATRGIPYPMRLPDAAPLDVDGPPRIVFVGRLEPRKRPEVLLAAAPRILASTPDARLVFVGGDGIASGSRSSAKWLAQEASRLGIADSVEFTGPLDADGVHAQLRAATVGAFPSRWESFGYAAAEAAAVGRPVVTTDIPAFADFVQDGVTGFRVPADDVAAWGDAIASLLADRARAREMGEAGARVVRSLCDPQRVARETLAAHELARARWESRRGQRGRRT